MTTTATAEIAPKYFAILDPDDPERMTYWRRNARGALDPYPAKAKYGPILWKKPGPGHEHVTPAELRGTARRLWIRHWYETVAHPWRNRARAAIEADPAAAALAFGLLACRCCCCGRVLTDPATKCYGIGPECGKGLHGDALAWLNERLGRADAAEGARIPQETT